jgi:hypothetical protein
MAEVKNAFLKAKMNKDVDDRLMPSGEYRHAVNIQVTTAESSDAGALQNILGNTVERTFITADDCTCIGFFIDESKDFIYVFLTDNDTTETYNPSGAGSNHYIYKYNTYNGETVLLASGAFLNFHKSFPITGVNLLENLLFWTDNRNQPRKINVTKSAADYTIEDNISVAKYNPYKAIDVFKESELIEGEYETTMKDVTSLHLPNGGTASVNGDVNGGPTIAVKNVVISSYPMAIKAGMAVSRLDSSNEVKPLVNSQGVDQVAIVANDAQETGGPGSGIWGFSVEDDQQPPQSVNVELDEDDVLIFNANPYFIADYPGDSKLNEDKFIRFSYRFKFDDGEYSLQAPFTQICFIPQQDGYFMAQTAATGDELETMESTIVNFMQNKVNEIKLQVPLPTTGNSLNADLHISEIDILYSESTSSNTRVVETIPVEDLSENDTNVYEYLYQSKKPYKTLPNKDTTRVYDKIPVRALSQEVISNRVVYGNFQDKHTPPKSLDYKVTSGPKSDFNLGTGEGRLNPQGGAVVDQNVIVVEDVSGDIDIGYKITGQDIDGYILISGLASNGQNSYTVTLTESVSLPQGAQFYFNAISSDVHATSSVEYPSSTLKTNRSYQVGVILSDKFGRHSTVLISNNKEVVTVGNQSYSGSTFYSPYIDDGIEPDKWFGNSLKMRFSEKIGPTSANPFTYEPGVYNGDTSSEDYNPLGWYSYKVVVKQTEQEYYNVYTAGAIKGLPYNYSGNGDVLRPSTSYVALVNDNINKIPRDLSTVGPLDDQFRSSVRLFGRVENYEISDSGLIQKNTQYYPEGYSFTATGVESLFDGFDVLNFKTTPTGDVVPITDTKNPFSAFYKSESDPFIVEINTSKQADQQFGVPNTALTSGSNIDTFPGIKKLAVFETAPVESLLDIFWETSTSGLVEDLNLLIDASGETVGARDITDWNTTPYTESIRNDEGANFILNSTFTVKNAFGENVDPASIESVVIESVRNEFQQDKSGYFELVEDLPANPGFYNIKITEEHEENVFYGSSSANRNFTFVLSVQLVGEPYPESIQKIATLANEAPTIEAQGSTDGGLTMQISLTNSRGNKFHVRGFNGSGSFDNPHLYDLDTFHMEWTMLSAVNSAGASASSPSGLPYFSIGTYDRDGQQQQGQGQDAGDFCYLYQEINTAPVDTYTIVLQVQDAGGAGETDTIEIILDHYVTVDGDASYTQQYKQLDGGGQSEGADYNYAKILLINVASGLGAGWYAYKSNDNDGFDDMWDELTAASQDGNIELDKSNGQYSDWYYSTDKNDAIDEWVENAFSGQQDPYTISGEGKLSLRNNFSDFTFTLGE